MATSQLFRGEIQAAPIFYQPIRTEVSGLEDVIEGILGLVHSIFNRAADFSDDYEIGIPIAFAFSAAKVTYGFIKLSVPIGLGFSYQLGKQIFKR